jgi:hypothetical protein
MNPEDAAHDGLIEAGEYSLLSLNHITVEYSIDGLPVTSNCYLADWQPRPLRIIFLMENAREARYAIAQYENETSFLIIDNITYLRINELLFS